MPNWLKSDWQRKLIAILFAVLIWYSVALQLQERLGFSEVPVTIQAPPELVVMTPQEELRVSVVLRGSRRNIEKIQRRPEVSYRVPNNAAVGDHPIFLGAGNVKLPHGVRVESIEPEPLTVVLDHRRTIMIDVQTVFSGSPPEGMDIKRRTVSPNKVRVTGPESLLKQLEYIRTQPIELDENVTSNFDVERALVKPSDLVTMTPEKVDVVVELGRVNDEKFFDALQIFVVDAPNSEFYVEAFLEPVKPRIQAVVEGPKTIIDHLSQSSVRAFVDISDSRETEERILPVKLWINARNCRVRDNSIQPSTIRVKIGRRHQPKGPTPEGAAVTPENVPGTPAGTVDEPVETIPVVPVEGE